MQRAKNKFACGTNQLLYNMYSVHILKHLTLEECNISKKGINFSISILHRISIFLQVIITIYHIANILFLIYYTIFQCECASRLTFCAGQVKPQCFISQKIYHSLWRTLTRYLVTCGSILDTEYFFLLWPFLSNPKAVIPMVLVTAKLQ